LRLWTLHPRYLDSQGLLGLWREALLAQKVLSGGTRGYRNHPQLRRFIASGQPLAAINTFLIGILKEAQRRDYNFNKNKINGALPFIKLNETTGQLSYEWRLLKYKLKRRSPEAFAKIKSQETPQSHPMFRIIAGEVRAWEKVKDGI